MARAPVCRARPRPSWKPLPAKSWIWTRLHAWDLAWASENCAWARYDFSEQEVKAYFSEARVLDGLFGIIGKLFGVTIEPTPATLWHADARF